MWYSLHLEFKDGLVSYLYRRINEYVVIRNDIAVFTSRTFFQTGRYYQKFVIRVYHQCSGSVFQFLHIHEHVWRRNKPMRIIKKRITHAFYESVDLIADGDFIRFIRIYSPAVFVDLLPLQIIRFFAVCFELLNVLGELPNLIRTRYPNRHDKIYRFLSFTFYGLCDMIVVRPRFRHRKSVRYRLRKCGHWKQEKEYLQSQYVFCHYFLYIVNIRFRFLFWALHFSGQFQFLFTSLDRNLYFVSRL